MNSEAPLVILTMLADFLLKITFAFAVFWGISQLVDLPNRRFVIWLSFLVGAGAYWTWLISDFFADKRVHGAHTSTYASALTQSAWQIPISWAFPLTIVLRGAGSLYLLVLGYFLISYIRKQRHLRWVLGFACKPSNEITEIFQNIAEGLKVSECRLLLLTGITSPATIGWIRPIVLLPVACCERDISDLEDILRHELHHVRRRDFLVSRIVALFRALLFFHPAVWYVEKKLEFERELACDLAVVSDSPSRRLKYAECLVHFARLHVAEAQKPWGVDFAAASMHLKARVRSILTVPKKSSNWSLCLRATASIVLLAGLLNILPALAVAFSYVQQVAQPTGVVVTLSHSHVKARTNARTRVARRERLPAVSESVDMTARTATVHSEVADQFAQIPLDAANYPQVVLAPFRPRDSAQDTSSEAKIPEDKTATSGRSGSQSKRNLPWPTLTSIIMDTARQISTMAGRDDDHD